jgi:hypothetical protein
MNWNPVHCTACDCFKESVAAPFSLALLHLFIAAGATSIMINHAVLLPPLPPLLLLLLQGAYS